MHVDSHQRTAFSAGDVGVVGRETIRRNGVFTRERIHLRTRRHDLGPVDYVDGWTGLESVLTLDTIWPMVTFVVLDRPQASGNVLP